MCTYINSDFVLSNLLFDLDEDDSINFDIIAEYYNEILIAFEKNSIDSFSIDVVPESINNTINFYKDIFIKIGNDIYKRKEINMEYYKTYYPKNIVDIMAEAAEIVLKKYEKKVLIKSK